MRVSGLAVASGYVPARVLVCMSWLCVVRVGCMCEPHLRSSSGLGRSNRPHILNPPLLPTPQQKFPDPFLDASEQAQASSKVHIRVQQRNGRKCITTVAGLGEDLDVKRILKVRKVV